MKRTKKLFAALLTAVMTLCMGTTAFAAGEKPTDTASVTIKKNYVAANEGTTSPAETFTLAQVGEGRVTDGDAAYAPSLGTITGAAFAEGGAAKEGAQADITVALPRYTSVGVYEYTLKEITGTTAGVTYHNVPSSGKNTAPSPAWKAPDTIRCRAWPRSGKAARRYQEIPSS